MQTYQVDSGVHNADNLQKEPKVMFQHTVQVQGAPWLRLHFEDYDLGDRSYISITSLEDGGEQRFNAQSLPQWHNASAYLNGDAVDIMLYVAPGDEGIFFRMSEIQVGEPANILPDLCHNTDDRVASSDPAVGRLVVSSPDTTVTCTGWLASNGAYLTAGHCNPGNDVIQFDVPASEDDGTYNHPPPEDQYPSQRVSFLANTGWPGRDWAIHQVSRNSNTGLLPVEAYGGFYRMMQGGEHDTFRVTGYGRDKIPLGSTGGENADSRTQQTHAGAVIRETGGGFRAYWTFHAHIEGGNSGSPIIVEDTSLTVGIVTNCSDPEYDIVYGTSFRQDGLADSLQSFPGPNVTYVDNGHPTSQEDGGVFNPFDSVSDGVSAVSAGGILSIVAGTYPETLTINKAMRIEAPVGTVRIDPNAPPSLVAKTGNPQANAMGEEQTRDVPEEFRLVQNYPNPVSSETQIEFGLPEATRVSLVVYDVLGREVVRLVDGTMEAGVHEVDVDAANLPAGVYVYRIQAGEYVESRQMLVVR